jgi:hypothetical protein
MFDEDKDGHVSLDQLEEVLRNLGFRPTRQEVAAFMKEADVDGSTTLELEEFLGMMAKIEGAATTTDDDDTDSANKKRRGNSESISSGAESQSSQSQSQPDTPSQVL